MLRQQFEQIRTVWNRLTLNQRTLVIGVVVTALVATGLVMLSRPPQRYQIAFGGLSNDDAAAIVGQLQSKAIPYQVSADGSTVSVPSNRVADARLLAASEGLPKGGSVGFELFDKSSFGITDFAQRVNYQRALEGELVRTINSLDAVQSSRVNIVIPEQSLFTDNQQPTTASVVLQLKPAQRLTNAQINGISYLVSNSVPGLKPENLTLVDGSGNPIWSGSSTQTAGAGGVDDHMTKQQAYESNVAQQLQQLVSQVVGNQHAAVRVNAVLNWDQRTVDSETYSPDGQQGQVLSQQEKTSTSSSSSNTSSGTPGVQSNVQSYQEAQTPSSGDTATTKEVTTNYQLSRKVEHVVQAPGQLQRLAVAVVLDGKRVDPAVAQQIKDVVSTAAGIIPARGDEITVSAVPFADTIDTATLAGEKRSLLDQVLSIGKIVGMIVIPLAALIYARRLLLRQQPSPALPMPGGERSWQSAPTIADLQRISIREAQSTQPTVPAISPTQQQIKELAELDPAQMAQMIRTWMKEERR